MADNGRTPDLDAVARSDRLLDALGAGQPPPPGDPADRALADLLAGWRDETRWPPATGLVAENQAVAALERGRRHPPHVPRSRRGLALVGTVAATVLGLGGFGAVLATAQPGDALYGLRSTLFGEPQQVRDDRVALVAQTEFAKVQQMIVDGQWDLAKDKLAEVSDTVQNVNDAGRKQELLDQWNELNVKVEHRDPEATVPPAPESDPAVPPAEATTSVTLSTTPGAETTAPAESSETSETAAPTESSETTDAPATTPTSPPATTPAPTTTAPTASAPATTPAATGRETETPEPPDSGAAQTPRAETPATTAPARRGPATTAAEVEEQQEQKAPPETGEHAATQAESTDSGAER